MSGAVQSEGQRELSNNPTSPSRHSRAQLAREGRMCYRHSEWRPNVEKQG